MSTPPISPLAAGYRSDDSSFPRSYRPGPAKRYRVADGFDSLMSLFDNAMQGRITKIDQSAWKRCLSQLDFEKTLQITRFLFDNPGAVSRFEIGKATKLAIKPWGESRHSFAEFALILVRNIATEERRVSLFQDELSLKIAELFRQKHFETSKLDSLADLAQKQTGVLGRTITIPDPENPGFLLAHKFKRIDEEMDEFCREAAITVLFKKSGRFLSTLPEPIGVYSLKKIDAKIAELLPEDVDAKSPTVYIQRTTATYYKYLHEIEDDKEWGEARRKFLIDSGLQIRSGQTPPFADLYHNQSTLRRYQPLINLIPTYNNGAGRVERPFAGVRYPNAGADGTRDVGDGDLIVDLIEAPCKESFDLFKFRVGKMPYMLMNAIAKLSFVDTMMLAYRLEKLGLLDWENEDIITKTAKDLKDGQKWILQGFLDCSLQQADNFVEALPIDWEKQAKQLIFWLQTDFRGYTEYLKRGILPPGLYDDDMLVEINLAKAENYHPGKGFFSNGEQDLGCYNGPLGLVEYEKGWYFISAIAVGNYLSKFAIISPDRDTAA